VFTAGPAAPGPVDRQPLARGPQLFLQGLQGGPRFHRHREIAGAVLKELVELARAEHAWCAFTTAGQHRRAPAQAAAAAGR